MLIAYISIPVICLLAFTNFFIFKSFNGLEFQSRFVAVQEVFRNRLIEAKERMEKKLRNQLIRGEEPD